MTKTLQLKRGTTTANNAYTGSVGEITVDTTTHSIRVHDGSTAGGYTLAPGGEMNVIDTIQLNGTAQTVTDKTVNLAVQEPITSANKLSASLVDDSSTTNKKFVTTTEKNTWNGKQDSISDLGTIRTNASEALKQKSTLPTANADNLGKIYQFTGTTTASYTNGYIYQCNEHEIESSYTKEVVSGSLSVDWIYVTLETFEETYSTTGDYTFSYDGSDWSIGGETVDLGTIGIGIGGPTENGDSFTIHYVAAHTEYAWDTAQVSDLSSKQDVLTAGANITIDGSIISAAGYTEDLQYFGVRGNPNVWEFSTITMDMQRVNQITSGTLYKISSNSLVAYETLDTTTQFGTDMPRNANKTYVLFYGEDLVSDLGETKNYIWIDKDNIYYGDTCEGSDEKMVWFETQYGGGYIKTAKYTNDSGTTWSTVSIPLISVKFDAESKLEKQNNYNVAMFGFEKMIMIQGTIAFMLPAGKTSNGKYNYVIRTFTNFLNRLQSLPDDFTGYEVKAPWTTTYGDFTVDEENQCIFTDYSGTKYTDTSGNFIPYMYYYNGEPKSVPQNIVAIDNLQKQVDDLYELKADKKEVEVVNSKVEAGIVSNPQTLEYTISGRSITFTGGYTWYPKNPNYSSGDGQVEVTERTGGMTVTIPVNDNNQYFLFDDTHDQDADNWCWNKWEKSSETMIPDGEFCNRYSDIGYDWTIYKFVESTTGDEIYGTNGGGVYVGDAIYKVVELDSGYKCVVYLGHSTSVDNGAYTGYEDQDGVTHTGTWVRNSESLTKQAEDKDTLLSSRFHTWGSSDDPRTNCYWGYASDNSGTGNNTMGAIYWDGTKFVDQRSIIIIGNRITVCPGVRALMANGMNANEQAQYVDHTVDACIVDYIPYTLHDGDYEIVLTADDHIIWTQNATTDILTNTFYVDGVATIGCKIGTCHIEDIMMTSWTIDTPFRFVTQEQMSDVIDNIDKVKSQTTGYIKFWTGTQTEYDLITTKDPMTLYIILPAQA